MDAKNINEINQQFSLDWAVCNYCKRSIGHQLSRFREQRLTTSKNYFFSMKREIEAQERHEQPKILITEENKTALENYMAGTHVTDQMIYCKHCRRELKYRLNELTGEMMDVQFASNEPVTIETELTTTTEEFETPAQESAIDEIVTQEKPLAEIIPQTKISRRKYYQPKKRQDLVAIQADTDQKPPHDFTDDELFKIRYYHYGSTISMKVD